MNKRTNEEAGMREREKKGGKNVCKNRNRKMQIMNVNDDEC